MRRRSQFRSQFAYGSVKSIGMSLFISNAIGIFFYYFFFLLFFYYRLQRNVHASPLNNRAAYPPKIKRNVSLQTCSSSTKYILRGLCLCLLLFEIDFPKWIWQESFPRSTNICSPENYNDSVQSVQSSHIFQTRKKQRYYNCLHVVILLLLFHSDSKVDIKETSFKRNIRGVISHICCLLNDMFSGVNIL